MVMAPIPVRYNENAATYPINRPITVPCNFNTPISIALGGKEFIIPPALFIYSDTDDPGHCIAAAAVHPNLPRGKLARQFPCGRADKLWCRSLDYW
jgi:hypothetical protein